MNSLLFRKLSVNNCNVGKRLISSWIFYRKSDPCGNKLSIDVGLFAEDLSKSFDIDILSRWSSLKLIKLSLYLRTVEISLVDLVAPKTTDIIKEIVKCQQILYINKVVYKWVSTT